MPSSGLPAQYFSCTPDDKGIVVLLVVLLGCLHVLMRLVMFRMMRSSGTIRVVLSSSVDGVCLLIRSSYTIRCRCLTLLCGHALVLDAEDWFARQSKRRIHRTLFILHALFNDSEVIHRC